MPSRKVKAQAHELDAFAEKYELNAALYGDPIEFLFTVMANQLKTKDGKPLAADTHERVRAAETLMSHRFPKVKAQEVADPSRPMVQFSINMTPPPQIEVGKAPTKVIEIKSTEPSSG